jgi:hypothetical protein
MKGNQHQCGFEVFRWTGSGTAATPTTTPGDGALSNA